MGRLKRLVEAKPPPVVLVVVFEPKSEPDEEAGGRGVVAEAPKLNVEPVEGRKRDELAVFEAVVAGAEDPNRPVDDCCCWV